MNYFSNIEHCFLYDGSIEGLFSVIYECCNQKIIPSTIIPFNEYQERLFDIIIDTKTNYKKAKFVNDKLLNISEYSYYLIYMGFLSNQKNKEIIILKYFIETIKYGKKINGMKNNQTVIDITAMCKKVTHEIHRFTGFVRFKVLPGDVLYSVIEPDNNIIEYLVKHFIERLKNEHFILFDKKRGLIITYNTKECNYFREKEINIKKLETLSKEDEYEYLWKQYFDTISIKQRTNQRCQLNFMPKKYWKNMLEMEGK